MEPFNERLRNLRSAAGMTQEALARSADLSLSMVAKLERGGVDPSWSTIQRLARALGVNCLAFTEDEGRRPKTDPAPRRPRGRRKEG